MAALIKDIEGKEKIEKRKVEKIERKITVDGHEKRKLINWATGALTHHT